MTRYEAILLLCTFLLTAFAGYFVYREWTDPILLPWGPEQQAVALEAPQTPPAPPPVQPEVVQARFEEEMTGQFGQLATLMESRLSSYLGSLQTQTEAQAGKLEAASEVVQAALDGYQAATRSSLTELSGTLGLIDEMHSESASINSNLEEAREVWGQLFDDVSAISGSSANRLGEENFEFQTYSVEGAQTLSEIAKSLESSYNLPESDLSFLLNRFNEISYRYYYPGGRRPAYRVVANETLRVPVPKTAGRILEDYAFPEKPRSQVASLNQASAASTSLGENLSRQVGKLKSIEAHIHAVESLSESLGQMDLGAVGMNGGHETLSPDLQQAWLAFENALNAYRSATGSEAEKLAQADLQRAITRLLEQYEQDYLNAVDTPEDPLDFYLHFIEKYRPSVLPSTGGVQ